MDENTWCCFYCLEMDGPWGVCECARKEEELHAPLPPKKWKLVSWGQLRNFCMSPPSPTAVILFGGDRASCCDEAVGGFVDGEMVAVASISPLGEMQDGTPEIVGVYVDPHYRRRGYGTRVVKAAIERILSRGLGPKIRITLIADVMRGVLAKIDPQPPSGRWRLDVIDACVGGGLWP